MAKARRPRNRAGMLPGESRRRSLVVVERVSRPSEGEEEMMTAHNYIASTRRLDGTWSHQVEYRGQVWDLPGKVLERLLSQRESIIKEERSRRARDPLMVQADQVLGPGQ